MSNTVDEILDITAANTIFLFNHFIKKAMPDSYAHYIDNDENLAESTRKSIQAVANDAKKPIQALITEARVDGRKDAIGCSSVIEQEWRAYRGSSSYLEVALETINQTQLKENK